MKTLNHTMFRGNFSSITILVYGLIITYFPVHKEDSDLGSINHCHNITTTEHLLNFFLQLTSKLEEKSGFESQNQTAIS